MNTRSLGIFCIVGGLVYSVSGMLLAYGGVPTEPTEIKLHHVFNLIWVLGGLCGLLGMHLTRAAGASGITRATVGIPAIGLFLTGIDTIIGLLVPNAISIFAGSPAAFTAIGRLILLIGYLVLAIVVLRAKQWIGWARFAPLALLLAPFIGILIGGLLGIGFFQLIVIGFSWVTIGLAIYAQQLKTTEFERSKTQGDLSKISA